MDERFNDPRTSSGMTNPYLHQRSIHLWKLLWCKITEMSVIEFRCIMVKFAFLKITVYLPVLLCISAVCSHLRNGVPFLSACRKKNDWWLYNQEFVQSVLSVFFFFLHFHSSSVSSYFLFKTFLRRQLYWLFLLFAFFLSTLFLSSFSPFFNISVSVWINIWLHIWSAVCICCCEE